MNMFGEFFLLERAGQAPLRASRLSLGETAGRDEAWLQAMLFENPDLLPIADLDPSFGPLIPLCRELRTESGRVDNLYADRFGRLTLVECKLWRNPEARREVVAQVLDYARTLRRWSYSDLQRQVSMATGLKGNAPYELVRRHYPELIEHEFIDATARALRHGRFMLIIAGDGIREDVGALAELINRNAASDFTFGLVEVALYGFPDGTLAVQPRVLAKTAIIERTIVVLRDTAGGRVPSEPEDLVAPVPEQNAQRATSDERAAHADWWEPVLNMTFDDPDQDAPRLYWRNNLRAPLPWPNTWLLASSHAGRRDYSVTLVEGGEASLKTFRPAAAGLEPEILAELPPEAAIVVGTDGQEYFSSARSQADFATDDEAREWLCETLNAYVNVFRPLMKRLAAEKATAA
jgi:hypothetical protein